MWGTAMWGKRGWDFAIKVAEEARGARGGPSTTRKGPLPDARVLIVRF
jgi:hypothetical protein